MVSWCLDQERTFPKDTEALKIGLIPTAAKQKSEVRYMCRGKTGEEKMQRPISDANKTHFFRRGLKTLYLLENNSCLKKVLEEQLSTGLSVHFSSVNFKQI